MVGGGQGDRTVAWQSLRIGDAEPSFIDLAANRYLEAIEDDQRGCGPSFLRCVLKMTGTVLRNGPANGRRMDPPMKSSDIRPCSVILKRKMVQQEETEETENE